MKIHVSKIRFVCPKCNDGGVYYNNNTTTTIRYCNCNCKKKINPVRDYKETLEDTIVILLKKQGYTVKK